MNYLSIYWWLSVTGVMLFVIYRLFFNNHSKTLSILLLLPVTWPILAYLLAIQAYRFILKKDK